MGRGKLYTNEEKRRIQALHAEGNNIASIIIKTAKSRKGINNVLWPAVRRGRKKKLGRPRKTTAREDRLLLRKASNSLLSSAQLASLLPSKISKSTVLRRIKGCGYIKFRKFKNRK